MIYFGLSLCLILHVVSWFNVVACDHWSGLTITSLTFLYPPRTGPALHHSLCNLHEDNIKCNAIGNGVLGNPLHSAAAYQFCIALHCIALHLTSLCNKLNCTSNLRLWPPFNSFIRIQVAIYSIAMQYTEIHHNTCGLPVLHCIA